MPFSEVYRKQAALVVRALPKLRAKTVSRSRAARASICSFATCRVCRSISI